MSEKTPSEKQPSSAEVREKWKKYMFASVATYYDESVALSEGQGSTLTDFDGRQYLDFFGGILTVSIGQQHPKWKAALHAQIDRLGHTSTAYPTLPIVDLAEKLCNSAPGKMDKIFFSASGTEADETAYTLAQYYTKRQELIALRHGYSGRSLLAQSVTAHAKYRLQTTQVAAIKHAQAPYCYRCPWKATPENCGLQCAQDIEELIQTTTTGQIAGFLAEPIMGVGGFIEAPEGYFKTAVEIVRKYGGVFIADEVQTGFGRTGTHMWGIQHHGVEPDIVTMAKGIANGMPLGATMTRKEIADTWTGGNISTFGGNPLSAAAGNAVVDTIKEENLLENAKVQGARLKEGMKALQQKYKIIGDVRGRGLMVGVELVEDEPAKNRTPNLKATLRLFEETKKRGLLIGRGGLWGNTLRIAPALNIGSADIDTAIKILDESFAALG